jgi:hypothetical protein
VSSTFPPTFWRRFSVLKLVQLCRSVESDLALSRDTFRGHPSPRRLTQGRPFFSKYFCRVAQYCLNPLSRHKTISVLCRSGHGCHSRKCSRTRIHSPSIYSPRCSTLIRRSALHAIRRWSIRISPSGTIRRTSLSARPYVAPFFL